MDWSDEKFRYYNGEWCFGAMTTIDCDEHICPNLLWSCGDGECILWHDRFIFQNTVPVTIGCWNLRNMNFMCELNLVQRAWTLPNGLCWWWKFDSLYDDPRLSMNNPALSNEEKCIYLIRCALSDGFEVDCPCNHLNCSYIMPDVCEEGRTYPYPPGPLVRPYIRTHYDWTSDFENKLPLLFLSGNVRCRGFHGYFNSSLGIHINR